MNYPLGEARLEAGPHAAVDKDGHILNGSVAAQAAASVQTQNTQPNIQLDCLGSRLTPLANCNVPNANASPRPAVGSAPIACATRQADSHATTLTPVAARPILVQASTGETCTFITTGADWRPPTDQEGKSTPRSDPTSQDAVTPTADAFLGSPVRSRPSASLCSPVPPPSAVKREVNEAAMALTWLAEALVGPEATSPQPAPRHTAAAAALLSADRTTGGLRGRRAASQRYSLMLQELAADEEGPRQKTPRFAGASDGSRSARRGPRTSDVHVGATLSNRKPKVYTQNSRVGRAMASIEHFIHAQQAEYESTTGNGVPERVIRQEYGNNPDTSKALRFLVAEKKIVRGGQGGRRDPFSYKMAPGYIYVPLPPVEDDAHDTSAAAGYDQEEAGDFSPAASTEQDLSAGEIAFTPAPGAAAMATLAAFSAGKWPQQLQAGGRRGAIQPRLSLNMSDPLLLNTAAGFAAGSALTHTDMETTTAADRPQLAGCKRSASTHSSLTTPAPASGQGPAKRLAAGAGPAGLAAAAVMGPGVGQAALDLPTPSSAGLDLSCAGPPSTQDAAKLTSWTAQLPAAQTLATASPAPAALPGACSVATPASAGLSVPSVQAAYLMQLQAQLFWQQQKWMAQQGQGRADAQSAAATMEQAHT